MNVLSFIFQVSKPYRLYIIGIIFTMLGVAAFANLQSYFLKLIVDYFSGVKSFSLKELAFIFIGMQMLPTLSWAISDYCIGKINAMKSHAVNILLEKIKDYEISFFHDYLSGTISSKLKDAASKTNNFLYTLIYTFIEFILLIAISTIIIATFNIKLAFLILFLISLFIIVFAFKVKKITKMSENTAEAESHIWGLVGDLLSNMLTVRQFAHFSKEQKNLERAQKTYNQKAWVQNTYLRKLYFNAGIFVLIGFLGVGYFIVTLHKAGQITTGDIAYILTICYKILNDLFNLTHHMRTQFADYGTIKNALSILEFKRFIKDEENAKELKVAKGNIIFNKVKFYYKNMSALFQNKSVNIRAGEKVGLVGYSGSGKSTFVNLILRLYDVTGGEILIDQQNIADVKQDSLRRNIAIIPQESSLFHRSLLENIRYGRLDATDEEVIEAAKSAYAHDFIMKLPENYQSLVGERGIKLSGGQRQRIAIARSFLKNAPILVLDEATSQLDSVTEKYIQESLSKLMMGKTTIVIAHRLSTLLNMDRILVFDQGKIVEDGNHTELLSLNGLYKSMWSAQIGGFLPEKK